VRVAFVGKGGAGKTTLAALFCRQLAADGAAVLAVDADINQNLAQALGVSEIPAPLGANLDAIKEYLRGDNPRIGSAAEMLKTTPPGRGSRLLRVDEPNPIWAACVRRSGSIGLAVTGAFAEADLGVACYHSKVGAVELVLNHLLDEPDEFVVVDMTAGADAFASGLFTRFDRTFIVCEPTVRGVGVYQQYLSYARDFDVRISVIGNKVVDEADVEFLRAHAAADLVTYVGVSSYVRAAERGVTRPIHELEAENAAALLDLRKVVEGIERDWAKLTAQTVEFHLRNAVAWGNNKTGVDLATQVDPEFVLGPARV
jgi:CO dehydrogenase maturation factor